MVYAPTIIMLTVLIMSFFVAGIFSNEFGWKADSVFFSARYGRNRGTFSKIAAGLIVITGVYWLVILIYSAVVFSVAGIGGANCVIQTSWAFWKSFYNITYLQAYLLTVIGGYVGALFILAVSMLVSCQDTYNCFSCYNSICTVIHSILFGWIFSIIRCIRTFARPALADKYGN